MTEPLKLVPSKNEDDDDDLIDSVKRVDELVDELITVNEKLKDELEAIRLVLGIERIEFERLRENGFHGLLRVGAVQVIDTVDKVVEKLEKVLGYV